MRTPKTLLWVSIVLSCLALFLTYQWFGMKALLCGFLFEWGRNAYKAYKKQKEEIEDEAFNEDMMRILKKD